MTRLVLTSPHGLGLRNTDHADIAVPSPFASYRDRWRPPTSLQPILPRVRTTTPQVNHWSDDVGRWPLAIKAGRDLGLLEFCRQCERVELWFDPNPNNQMHVVWLLDYFCSYPEIVARLKLRLIDRWWGGTHLTNDRLWRWDPMLIKPERG